MSARPAILYTIVLFILLPIYFAARPASGPSSVLKENKESLLKLNSIDAISISRSGESLRFHKSADGKLYEVSSPPGKFIPEDLMDAVVQLLIGAKSVEVVAENSSDLSQFGLDHPNSELDIEASGQATPIKIIFGDENPTRTAIYAQIEGNPKVYLLGKDIEYYRDLMFEWIEGKQGKNA
ncbi:MAG TPA: DUF4340 domain-containing protein [Candidatus Binataceae bacterium]|nr:DUF4340 domain-containing protein [Candidatus Binataceae bacterium]